MADEQSDRDMERRRRPQGSTSDEDMMGSADEEFEDIDEMEDEDEEEALDEE